MLNIEDREEDEVIVNSVKVVKVLSLTDQLILSSCLLMRHVVLLHH
jgi:hypothetical protein